MPKNRIEIKIIKDKSQDKIDIKAMSLDSAKALLLLFESLTKIVELTPDNQDIRIQLTEGSAVVAAEGEKISHALEEFEEVISNRCTNKAVVEQWRRIQKVFSANGLQYEANFYDKGTAVPFFDRLRKHHTLRAKRVVEKKFDSRIAFVKGKLIAAGGKNPNIHVEVDGKALPPIHCTESSATKATPYLYKTIYFSTWETKIGNTNRYVLCDSYSNEEIFNELSSTVKKLNTMEQVAALKDLHYRFRGYLDKQDYPTVRRLIRLFTHEDTDINVLKTILIVTQSLKSHDRLSTLIKNVQTVFDKKYLECLKNK